MIIHITHNLMGGLGNQLFQIFFTISMALKYNIHFFFERKEQLGEGLGITVRQTYWDSLLKEMQPHLVPNISLIKNEERVFNIHNIEENNAESFMDDFTKNNGISEEQLVILNGYFQSPLYFEMHESEIMEITGLNRIIRDFKETVDLDKKNQTVSIHFRIGDYVKYPDCHPILPVQYYINSIHHILQIVKDIKYVEYFFENSDIHMVSQSIFELRNTFPFLVFIRNREKVDWKQMIVMSFCKYNIIANSTFSWWGAYLNTNKDKIVCYPDVWFGDAIIVQTNKTLFPEEWICISTKIGGE